MPNEKTQVPAPSAAVGVVDAGSDLKEFITKTKDTVVKASPKATQPALAALLDELFTVLAQRPELVEADAVETIRGVVADIDARLARRVNAILHDPKFQQLEAAWRGLAHLVGKAKTQGGMIQIKVMNIKKSELGAMLRQYNKESNFELSPLFQRIYTEEYNTAGGWPFGLMVGDYAFDHSPADVDLLRGLARVAAASHAPFIAGASPGLFGLDSWTQLRGGLDLAGKVRDDDHAAFNALRDSEDSKYLGLAMPRFLARAPYGPRTDPVEGFAFEEEIVDERDAKDDSVQRQHQRYCWANAAYAMAANIARAFHKYHWCAAIRGYESGGAVENLPLHTFKAESGEVEMKCPTETYIPDDKELVLSNLGLLPLVMWKRTTTAAFLSGQSLQRPKNYPNSADATANARLTARLPYLFAACRFAHYLKVMMRLRIGRSMSRDQIEKELNDWIVSYVSPENSSEIVKRSQPLAEARVTVVADPRNPGYYRAEFHLRPHFQVEGLKMALMLVARMPNKGE